MKQLITNFIYGAMFFYTLVALLALTNGCAGLATAVKEEAYAIGAAAEVVERVAKEAPRARKRSRRSYRKPRPKCQIKICRRKVETRKWYSPWPDIKWEKKEQCLFPGEKCKW